MGIEEGDDLVGADDLIVVARMPPPVGLAGEGVGRPIDRVGDGGAGQGQRLGRNRADLRRQGRSQGPPDRQLDERHLPLRRLAQGVGGALTADRPEGDDGVEADPRPVGLKSGGRGVKAARIVQAAEGDGGLLADVKVSVLEQRKQEGCVAPVRAVAEKEGRLGARDGGG